MYALVKDKTLIEYNLYIKWFPDISFPDCGPSKEWMKDNDVYVVNDTLPVFDETLYNFSWTEPYYDKDSDEVLMFKLIKKTRQELDEEVEKQILQSWHSLRKVRNELLDDADRVLIRFLEQGHPVPAEWLTYKQTLRDLPDKTEHPFNVVWPVIPTHTFNLVQVI